MRYFATQRGIIQDSYYLGGCVCGGIGQQIVSLRLKLHSGNCHAAADDRRTRHHGFENPDPQPPAEPQGHHQAGGSGQVRPHVRNTSGSLHSIIPAEKPEIFGQIPSHNRDPDIPKIGQVRKYFENKIEAADNSAVSGSLWREKQQTVYEQDIKNFRSYLANKAKGFLREYDYAPNTKKEISCNY